MIVIKYFDFQEMFERLKIDRTKSSDRSLIFDKN